MLTKMSDVPHGLDARVALVEDYKQRRCSEALCQHAAVKTFPDQKNNKLITHKKNLCNNEHYWSIIVTKPFFFCIKHSG